MERHNILFLPTTCFQTVADERSRESLYSEAISLFSSSCPQSMLKFVNLPLGERESAVESAEAIFPDYAAATSLSFLEGHPLRTVGLVNFCNSRFAPTGGLINEAIHKMEGPQYRADCLETCAVSGITRDAGSVITILLPHTSPLYSERGLTAVINVVELPAPPPQMQQLVDLYCEEMRKCLASIFSAFRQVVQKEEFLAHKLCTNSESKDNQTTSSKESLPKEKTRKIYSTSDTNSEKEPEVIEPDCLPQVPRYIFNNANIRGSKLPFHADLLYMYVDHPEGHSSQVFMETAHCVVVYDAFPKAKIHLLVLPKRHLLPTRCGCRDLKPSMWPAVQEMHRVARHVMFGLTEQLGSSEVRFRAGYHAIPSMFPLHLHIISTDFESDGMKTKRHWNTFTTDFFIPGNAVEYIVSEGRHPEASLLSPMTRLGLRAMGLSTQELDSKEEGPMRCPACCAALSNMKKVKAHLIECDRLTDWGDGLSG